MAVAMASGSYSMTMPKVCNIILQGNLKPLATAKDAILHILRQLTVKVVLGRYLNTLVRELNIFQFRKGLQLQIWELN